MSTEDGKPTALVPAQTAALSRAGVKSLAARGRDLLRQKEEAAKWLRKGLELRETTPDDPLVRGPINPYAIQQTIPDLCAQLQTAVRYINHVLAGSNPDQAAESLGMTRDDMEVAHVAYFFVPEVLAAVIGKSAAWVGKRVEDHADGTAPAIIPSPAGMNDGVLTQKTVELSVQISLELERIQQQACKREKTLEEAFRCFETGHELDSWNPELMYWLANSYYWGYGVREDKERAATLYRRAADEGHSNAQYCLGVLYSEGEGVERDEVKAAVWLSKAAEQGNTDAQISLGLAYKTGMGVPQDYAQGATWLRRAGEREDFGDSVAN
jgi:hypothetical protein